MTQEATESACALAAFAAQSDITRMPAHVVRTAKACLLYAVAVGIASRTAPMATMIARALDLEYGEAGGPVTRMLDGRAVATGAGAYANAVLLHGRVQEDAHPAGHVGVVVVPAAIAMAQAQRASGPALLAGRQGTGAATGRGGQTGNQHCGGWGRVGLGWRRGVPVCLYPSQPSAASPQKTFAARNACAANGRPRGPVGDPQHPRLRPPPRRPNVPGPHARWLGGSGRVTGARRVAGQAAPPQPRAAGRRRPGRQGISSPHAFLAGHDGRDFNEWAKGEVRRAPHREVRPRPPRKPRHPPPTPPGALLSDPDQPGLRRTPADGPPGVERECVRRRGGTLLCGLCGSTGAGGRWFGAFWAKDVAIRADGGVGGRGIGFCVRTYTRPGEKE